LAGLYHGGTANRTRNSRSFGRSHREWFAVMGKEIVDDPVLLWRMAKSAETRRVILSNMNHSMRECIR
jgi:hypothetical protein